MTEADVVEYVDDATEYAETIDQAVAYAECVETAAQVVEFVESDPPPDDGEDVDSDLLDDFDRPDENPATGWLPFAASSYSEGPGAIVDGALEPSVAFYNAGKWPAIQTPPCHLWVTIRRFLPDAGGGLYLSLLEGADDVDAEYTSGFEAAIIHPDWQSTWNAYSVGGGYIAEGTAPEAIAPGDAIGCDYDGETYRILYRPAGGDWVVIGSQADDSGADISGYFVVYPYCEPDDLAIDDVHGGPGLIT